MCTNTHVRIEFHFVFGQGHYSDAVSISSYCYCPHGDTASQSTCSCFIQSTRMRSSTRLQQTSQDDLWDHPCRQFIVANITVNSFLYACSYLCVSTYCVHFKFTLYSIQMPLNDDVCTHVSRVLQEVNYTVYTFLGVLQEVSINSKWLYMYTSLQLHVPRSVAGS